MALPEMIDSVNAWGATNIGYVWPLFWTLAKIMDKFNEVVFAGGARLLGGGLWNFGDKKLIDGLFVNGSAKMVGWISSIVRTGQTGYIYHYAFVMIIGVLASLMYFLPSLKYFLSFWHA